MKVSLNWIKQFTAVDLPVDELVELAVTRIGGIEGYTEHARQFQGVVVAEVVSCEPHPNADKLSLCTINDNQAVAGIERDDDGNVQVVCGAPNVEAGQLIAWIPPGAVVPGTFDDAEPFVLEPKELRGEISQGMIASPKELGLSDDHQGILVIEDDEAAAGQSLAELYELDDTIIDIENKMLTHRPDGFGQLGLAREIAGIQHQAFTSPDWYREDAAIPASDGNSDKIKGIELSVEVPELCPRYMAIALDDIQVGPSPQWLQSRLMRVGLRPINNVVDVTNYVMMLTAQPIHAFDYDKIADNGVAKLVVRKPKAGERLELLNGDTIEPRADAVMISNHQQSIALGGVIGGANSEVGDQTQRLLLECANFDMYNIRRTSMEHGLFTDAVTRFSKGQSPRQLQPVMAYAVKLLQELCGARVIGQPVDVNHAANHTNPEIELSLDFINSRLGSDLSPGQVASLLSNVEFEVEQTDSKFRVRAPFWRTDIAIREDVLEEVGRLHGFDQLPRSLPTRSIKPSSEESILSGQRFIRRALASSGANQVMTHSFVNSQLMEKAGQNPEHAFKLANALSRELEYYRLTPLPSLLDSVHQNIKAGHEEFVLFEIGTGHNKQHHADDDHGLPTELQFLDLVYAAKQPSQGAAFYKMRSVIDQLLSDIGQQQLVYKPISEPLGYAVTAPFDHTRSALVETADGLFVGIVGELKQSVVGNFKLPECSAAASLDLLQLVKLVTSQKSDYQPLSKYPAVTQDVTLSHETDLSYAKLSSSFSTELSKVLAASQSYSVMPLGIYLDQEKNQLHTSLRVRVVDRNQTLQAEQVNDLLDQAVATTAGTSRV